MNTAHIDLIDLYRAFVAHAAPGESRLEIFGGTGGNEIVKVAWDGSANARWSYCMSLVMFSQYASSADVGRWLAGKLRNALDEPPPATHKTKP
jgi:hypothetical protein